MLGRRPHFGGMDGGAEEADVVVWMPWVLTSGHTYLVCILLDLEGHAFAAMQDRCL